jgi:hypothetical protein
MKRRGQRAGSVAPVCITRERSLPQLEEVTNRVLV